MSFNEKIYWIVLNRIRGVSPITQRILVDRFGSIEQVFSRSWEDLASVSNVSLKTAKKIASINENHIQSIESFIVYLEEEGITIYTPADEEYPQALHNLKDAPTIL